eukprot:gb/GECG01016732.1/.p1 GENE.gb/GECG01016732.1/~~gb/GECG01016732.1/.p1  ORF type:complete len:1159 (+),score=77.20 gb/GECG01016732.1/:1-3477(+)
MNEYPASLVRLGLEPCTLQHHLLQNHYGSPYSSSSSSPSCCSERPYEDLLGPNGRQIWYHPDPDERCEAALRRATMILRRDFCPEPEMKATQKQVVMACAQAVEETGKSSVWCSKQIQFTGKGKVQPATNGGGTRGNPAAASITTNSDIHHFCEAPWMRLLGEIGPLRMMRLLCCSCLFEELENGCTWQITGSPLHDQRVWQTERSVELQQKRTYFNRTRMMYCATFPRKPGLPSNHLISTYSREYANTVGHLDGFSRNKARRFLKDLLKESASILPQGSVAQRLYTDLLVSNSTEGQQFLDSKISIVQQFLNRSDRLFYFPLRKGKIRNSAFSEALNWHCPLPKGWSKHTPTERDEAYSDIPEYPIKYAYTGEQVFKLVKAVFERCLSRELFPSNSSRRTFYSKIFQFLCSGRSDSFHSDWLVFEYNSSVAGCKRHAEVPAVVLDGNEHVAKKQKHGFSRASPKPRVDFEQYEYGFCTVFRLWFVEHLVIPLIRNNFYVTESGAFRSRCFYYRKPVWALLCRLATERLKSTLDLQSVSSFEHFDKKGNCTPMRLVPKGNGVRPIMNLSSSKVFKFQGRLLGGDRGGSNLKLKNPQLLLSRLRRVKPHCLGAAVFGLDDIHVKWGQTVGKLRPAAQHGQTFSKDMPRLGITLAGVDMKQCYDNIRHDKLLEILNETFSGTLSKRTPIWRYTATVPSVKAREEEQKRMNLLRGRTRFSRVASLENNLLALSFPRFVNYVAKGSRNQVFARNPPHYLIDSANAYQVLRDHIMNHCVTFRGHFYIQGHGIPQGSVVSSILCNLYFGHMENNDIIPSLSRGLRQSSQKRQEKPPVTLLMRLTDDYLIASTSEKMVSRFITKLHRGSKEYNCWVNPSKTVTSHDLKFQHDSVEAAGPFSKRLVVFPRGFICLQSWLPSCGILIGVATGEVLTDVTRIVKPTRIRDCITMHYRTNLSSWELLNVFKGFLRANCLGILFDRSISSLQVIALNTFHVALIATLKLICVLRKQSSSLLSDKEPCITVLEEASSYLYALIRQRVASHSPTPESSKGVGPIILGSEPVGKLSGNISQITSHKASLVRHREIGAWCDLSQQEVKFLLFKAFSFLFHGKYSKNCSKEVLKTIDLRLTSLLKHFPEAPDRNEAVRSATFKENSSFVDQIVLH